MKRCTAARASPERRLGRKRSGIGARELHERAQRLRASACGCSVLAERAGLLGDAAAGTPGRSCTGRCPCRAGTAGRRGRGRACASRAIVVSSVTTIASQPQRLGARDEALDELVRRCSSRAGTSAGCRRAPRAHSSIGARGLVGEDHRHALGRARRARPRGRRRGAASSSTPIGREQERRRRAGGRTARRDVSRCARRRAASAARSASGRRPRGSRARCPRCRRPPAM